MCRYIIILYCITLTFSTDSIKRVSGEVIYGCKPNIVDKNKKAKSKELYEVLDKLNKSAEDITFKLDFNENESYFNINVGMSSDLKPGVISYAKNIISKGKYYYNKNKDELLVESSVYDKYTLIKSKPSSIKWKIHKETKIIDSYICTKATTTKIVKNRKVEKSFEIVAWFTTSIPANYGPLEFSGLPGLILELKSKSHTFYAKQIKFKDTFIKVKTLDSKHIITSEQHEENLKKIN